MLSRDVDLRGGGGGEPFGGIGHADLDGCGNNVLARWNFDGDAQS